MIIGFGSASRDHIHTVMIIPPKYAVSAVVGRLKGQTSSLLRKKFQWLEKV
ncbi:MAG: IS200/IS605 family transposase, partial [Candidatus Makaraimicrobium thalassicum]